MKSKLESEDYLKYALELVVYCCLLHDLLVTHRSLQIFIQNLWDNCQSIIQLGFHIDGFAQLDIVPDEKEVFE